MVDINVEITGLRELARNKSKLQKSFARTTLRSALTAAAKPVVKEAQARVPVASGDLRRGIGSQTRLTRRGFGYTLIGFDRDVFYGGVIELGSSRQPARPFLRPAIDEAHRNGSILEAFVRSINKTIERTLRRVR